MKNALKTLFTLLILAGTAAALQTTTQKIMEIHQDAEEVTITIPYAGEPSCPCAMWTISANTFQPCQHPWADGTQTCEYTLQTGRTYTFTAELGCGCSSQDPYLNVYQDTQTIRPRQGGKIPAEWRAWRNSMDPPMGEYELWQQDVNIRWRIQRNRIGEWLRSVWN